MKNNPNNIEVIDPVIINTNSNMSTDTQTPVDLDNLSEDQLLAALKKKQELKQQEEQEKINAYVKDNEDFVTFTVSKVKQLHNELKKLKKQTISDANALYNRMYEVQGKVPTEVKTFSRLNKEGNLKVTVERQERFEFTEEAMVHINEIKAIFKEKFEGRNKGLYNILDGLLIKGSKGDYDPKLLAKARNQVRALGDAKLIEEFDKLDDCQRVTGSSMYCRVYEKIEDVNGKIAWQDISLNFSSL